MDNTEKKGFLSKLSDNTKVSIFRWWFAGAVYFFVAWGTNIGLNSDPTDLILILGIASGICNIFIFNPIAYGMFEIKRRGNIVNKKYYQRTILEGSLVKLAEIFKCLFIVFLVFLTYQLLNAGINALLKQSEAIPVPGEPILFATFFLVYYNLCTFLYFKIIDLFLKIKDRKKAKNIE